MSHVFEKWRSGLPPSFLASKRTLRMAPTPGLDSALGGALWIHSPEDSSPEAGPFPILGLVWISPQVGRRNWVHISSQL